MRVQPANGIGVNVKSLLAVLALVLLAAPVHALPYQLLFETDADVSGGSNEVFVASYDTLTDLFTTNNNISETGFLGIDMASSVSVGGLVAVPEPTTALLLACGLVGLVVRRRH